MRNNLDEDESSPNKINESSDPNIINKKNKSIKNDYNSNSKNSSLLRKKYKRTEELDDEDNIIYKILKINDDIQKITENQIKKEKDKLKKEIEENENKLKSIKKFEIIKKQLNSYLKSSFNMNSEIKDITSDYKKKR